MEEKKRTATLTLTLTLTLMEEKKRTATLEGLKTPMAVQTLLHEAREKASSLEEELELERMKSHREEPQGGAITTLIRPGSIEDELYSAPGSGDNGESALEWMVKAEEEERALELDLQETKRWLAGAEREREKALV